MSLKKYLNKKSAKELGASLVEYGLLVALIAVICIAAIRVLGQSVSTKFSQVSSGVGGAGNTTVVVP